MTSTRKTMLTVFQVVAVFVLVGLALSPGVGQGWREFAVIFFGVGLVSKIGEGMRFRDVRKRVGTRWAFALAGLLAAASFALVWWVLDRAN